MKRRYRMRLDGHSMQPSNKAIKEVEKERELEEKGLISKSPLRYHCESCTCEEKE